MNTGLANTSVYTDFQEVAALRREAGKNAPAALEKAAKQFEAMFMQMMLKSMRDAGAEEGGLFDNEQTRLYQDMYDKQLSLSLSEAGNGIGLAKLLVQQLQTSVPALQGEPGAGRSGTGVEASQAVPQRGARAFSLLPQAEGAAPEGADKTGQMDEPQRFDSPEQFVTTLWPHALRTGEKLGVDPRAILAQAALETGWGKAVIQRPDGRSSYNLFNIKADHRWDGDRVGKQTLEYRDGVAYREQASFRAYGSWSESFDDYAAFIKGSERYRHALEAGRDASAYAEQLQRAGYATDPAYAQKINRILNNDILARADNGLKLPAEGTLTS